VPAEGDDTAVTPLACTISDTATMLGVSRHMVMECVQADALKTFGRGRGLRITLHSILIFAGFPAYLSPSNTHPAIQIGGIMVDNLRINPHIC
jgi:hypothetical protein